MPATLATSPQPQDINRFNEAYAGLASSGSKVYAPLNGNPTHEAPDTDVTHLTATLNGSADGKETNRASNSTSNSSTGSATSSASHTNTDHLNSVDELIRERAANIPDTVLIAYPSAHNQCADWIEYTSRDLDVYADEAAKELTRLGLVPKERKSTKSEVVALLGPSDLDYAIAFLALTRMGFAVLFLSTRLPVEAYVSLLDKTDCTRMLTTPRFGDSVRGIRLQRELHTLDILPKAVYAREPTTARFEPLTEVHDRPRSCAFIVHSSGSTGLPKPIFQTHRACLSNYAVGSGMRAFVTLPLFHNSGISTTFRGIVAGRRTAIYNAGIPLTNASMVEGMRVIDPESFHCVPYVLKILAETDEGIRAPARCKVVIFAGSGCPDDLGDLLVDRGVYLIAHYGQTEMGQLMMSARDRSDKSWNYMRAFPNAKPYLHMDPIGDGQYEAVVLDGLPTKVMSNSDTPAPDSYRTRDTFVPHTNIPDAWKHVGRLDDRLTLVNGEKVLPVPMEGTIRQDELVRECLVFGVGRAFPGLLVVRSDKADPRWGRGEYLDRIWPSVARANAAAERFGQIEREMVEVLDADADYPRTDKGTIIRAATYKRFAGLIESVYTRFERPSAGDGDVAGSSPSPSLPNGTAAITGAAAKSVTGGAGQLQDVEGFKAYLLALFRDRLGLKDVTADTDFFGAGMDSLQAIVARGHMMRQLNLGGFVLGQNVIFEHPSIRQMAEYLASLVSGSPAGAKQKQGQRGEEDRSTVMRELVERYGTFDRFVPGDKTPETDAVLLTGATGSLGAHVLAQLLALPHVSRVYCLVRASDATSAAARVFASLSERGLGAALTPGQAAKVTALPADLSVPSLGLDGNILADLRGTVTGIIHSAWAVNFNIGIASFAAVHLAGVHNLLALALSASFPRPARFAFVSSISAAAGTPLPARVAERFVADPAHAQAMGYARSKWVAEHVVRRAAEEAAVGSSAFARVLRTGQVVGDSRGGRWNPTEAIPLMIRAAATLGALPRLDEAPSWIPVDVCARAVVELSGAGVPFANELADETRGAQTGGSGDPAHVVYHVLNPRTFSWTTELLPALRAAGLEFEEVGQREWVRRLREGEQDPVKNPTVKLVDFFADKYDNDRPGRGGLVFETEKTERRSAAIAQRFDVIGSGLIKKCVESWKRQW